jgi:hypothetical protein
MHDERGSAEIVVESLGERLRAFPFYAIIAFAARFVRRVEPLTEGLPPHHQGPFSLAAFVAEQFATNHREAIRATWAAIEVADAVSEAAWAVEAGDASDAPKGAARALLAAEAAIRAVKAAVEVLETGSSAGTLLATEAATWAARTASLAVVAAAEATGTPDEIVAATVVADLDHLESMALDGPGTFGKPIDPSESGQLGPLWPDGAPAWFTNPSSIGEPAPVVNKVAIDSSGRHDLLIEVIATEPAHDRDFIRMVGQLVARADEIHRGLNGHGLQVDYADFDDGSFLTAEVSHGQEA